jgi:glycerol-3-phosphate acyltransferase PlsX
MTVVALDAYGADAGPELVMEGAALAGADGIAVKVFGPASLQPQAGVEVEACEHWIDNESDPVSAVRSTPEASVVRAAAEVAAGRAAGLVSAGSTGATMTAALFALKRLQGVQRPALAVQIPRPNAGPSAPHVLMLDAGANTEARAQHLIQFAYLGSAFSQTVLSIAAPRVALLSVGEEQKKGNPEVVEANNVLGNADGLDFVGNVEGRDLLTGAADVVVTDGFTGNVALKTLEGTARAVADAVRGAARSGPLAAAGGLLLRPALGGLRRRMDPDAVGGAVLLGLRGVAVVAHGSSGAEGIANAVRLADRAVRERALERTAEALERAGATRGGLRNSQRAGEG